MPPNPMAQPAAPVPLLLCLLLQLLAAVDLNDPAVQATMLAMLPLPEDLGEADKENGGGQPGEGRAAAARGIAAGLALEGAAWPVGQVRGGGEGSRGTSLLALHIFVYC